jgi:amino acid transporter
MSQTPTPSSNNADPSNDRLPLGQRIRRIVVGAPKSLGDNSLFHRLTLIPFLAWVGLGADGLSSSSYGPDEAFREVSEHSYLLILLAIMTAVTVALIASAYSRIIEEFPHGGGGYVVATKLLGKPAGILSGCALLVDYVLTIAVSIAAAGDAIFSFLPPHWHALKLPTEIVFILGLTVLNIRGVRESVMALMPIFLVFLVTHAVGILWGVFSHLPEVPSTFRAVSGGFAQGTTMLGVGGMLFLLLHAYSMGGGTYTGIEAVSNGLPIMREPRVQTAKRTMTYMAVSLAVTASGLLVCYLLWHVAPASGKTMNAILWERMAADIPGGQVLVMITLASEGALLIVAAQAGFIDGPRVLANTALDSWMPRRFASLSERLTTQNGIVLMGASALVVLLHARGDVRQLVVMYSINVFLTFSLSMLGMLLLTVRTRARREHWKRRTGLFAGGLLLCATVLVITILTKFREGGWLTVMVTAILVALCFIIRSHYRTVGVKLARLYAELNPVLSAVQKQASADSSVIEPTKPTAVLLVAGYGGLGIHTLLNIFRAFPDHFHNLVVLSVGVLDSGEFKGEGAVEELRRSTEAGVAKYVDLAQRLGVPAEGRTAIGTDAVDEAERLCLTALREFPQSTFFAGQVIFRRQQWYQRLLHNETAFAIQKRLQWAGQTMVILPARVS